MFIVTVGYITFIATIVLLIRFILYSEYALPFNPMTYTVPLEIKLSTLIAAILAGYGFYSIPSFTDRKDVQGLFPYRSKSLSQTDF